MRMSWLVVPAFMSLSCVDPGPFPGGPIVFPPEDPGVRLPAASLQGAPWAPIWDPQSGRLVFAVHTGQYLGADLVYPVSFKIVSYDPAAPALPLTLASRVEGGGLRALAIASQTGTLYYQYFPGHSTPRVSLELSRVPAGASDPTLVPTPVPLRDGFLISADESRLVSSVWDASESYVSDPLTGVVHATIDATYVRALSPDATEALVGFEADKVISVATGATRTLSWKIGNNERFVDAAWIDGGVRLLIAGDEFIGPRLDTRRFSLFEWDEATGARTSLGWIETKSVFARLACAAWLPSTRSAVMLADSLVDYEHSRSYRTIVAMSGGTTTRVGSQINTSREYYAPSCALSPDGKWFAYRVGTDAVYLIAIPG